MKLLNTLPVFIYIYINDVYSLFNTVRLTSTQPYHLLKSFYLESFWWLCFYFKPEISFLFHFLPLLLWILPIPRGACSVLWDWQMIKNPKENKGFTTDIINEVSKPAAAEVSRGTALSFSPDQPSLILGMSSWTFSHINHSKSTVTVSSWHCFQLIKWKSFRKLFLILWLSVEEHGREMTDVYHMDNQVVEGLCCNRTASRCSGSPLKSVKKKCKILVAIKTVPHDFTFQWYKKSPQRPPLHLHIFSLKYGPESLKTVQKWTNAVSGSSHEIVHSVALWHFRFCAD